MTLEQACPPEYQRAQYAFKDSMTHGFCNSHYLSHFAAFFIDARTKRSVVKSFDYLLVSLRRNVVKSEFGYPPAGAPPADGRGPGDVLFRGRLPAEATVKVCSQRVDER